MYCCKTFYPHNSYSNYVLSDHVSILSVNILGTQIKRGITNKMSKDTNKLYANIKKKTTGVKHQILCIQSLYLLRCA